MLNPYTDPDPDQMGEMDPDPYALLKGSAIQTMKHCKKTGAMNEVKCLDPDLVFRSVRSGSGESLNTRVRIPNPHLGSDSVNFNPDP